ncbi:PepSY domain-containing protein [Alishewanella tabrizica]|uniref:PepSY domain-containing protein n=1 Tax=Alishewanella tabrizica TaxID=671278 RepID=A0ABQ2WPP1_9ALTE|nr:PepSY domain-containing protein [Alishewanella tabrizica]GGW62462.1 hypothetical protein GCM10008111_18030 [Alishewanella tabrizica]
MKLSVLTLCSLFLLTAPIVVNALELGTKAIQALNLQDQRAEDDKQPPTKPRATQNRTISKEVATQLAQQRYPGRILKVHSEQRTYKIRVMQTDGRVVNVVVDGQSGQVKREK